MPKYNIREFGSCIDIVTAPNPTAALEAYDLDTSCYETDLKSTMWIDLYAVNVDDRDDSDYVTIQIDPDPPACSSDHDEHDWQSPHEIVGGVKENPGVFGHGGGVIITEVCMHCGCRRTTDTWAQRSDTGEQGLESVEYEPEYYQIEQGSEK